MAAPRAGVAAGARLSALAWVIAALGAVAALAALYLWASVAAVLADQRRRHGTHHPKH
jgi:hypothetical protein